MLPDNRKRKFAEISDSVENLNNSELADNGPNNSGNLPEGSNDGGNLPKGSNNTGNSLESNNLIVNLTINKNILDKDSVPLLVLIREAKKNNKPEMLDDLKSIDPSNTADIEEINNILKPITLPEPNATDRVFKFRPGTEIEYLLIDCYKSYPSHTYLHYMDTQLNRWTWEKLIYGYCHIDKFKKSDKTNEDFDKLFFNIQKLAKDFYIKNLAIENSKLRLKNFSDFERGYFTTDLLLYKSKNRLDNLPANYPQNAEDDLPTNNPQRIEDNLPGNSPQNLETAARDALNNLWEFLNF